MNPYSNIEKPDVQALVARGYGNLPDAAYVLAEVTEPARARAWLQGLIGRTTFADSRPDTVALNLALSCHGLTALQVPADIVESFADEFRAGMTTPHKRRILGDEGINAPEHWDWGGPDTPPVDILFLLYAASPEVLNTECDRLRDQFEAAGLGEVITLETKESIEFKEHFGFRDSISQPYIAEFDSLQRDLANAVPLGEILLGYPNGYERFTRRPLVDPGRDTADHLVMDVEESGLKDLGRNGTYLVFRQLAQDVKGFWQFMHEQGGYCKGNDKPGEVEADAIHLASKMVGRWPSGAPLVLAPKEDQPEMEDKNSFAYHRTDQHGLKCPLGAHIRRTHPRDSLDPDPGTQASVDFSNRHRLLRRGRTYGKPFHPSMLPQDMLRHLDQGDNDEPRGLHFICLNANIGRQFEFVQNTWAGNPTFNGLYQDPDPLIGARQAFGGVQDHFTLQAEPVRCQVQGLPQFVRVRGGGYFFLPSRRAMSFLFQSH